VSGSANPASLNVSDEIFVTADYSTTAAPVYSDEPEPGGGRLRWTEFHADDQTEAGFAPDSLVFVNNLFRTATFCNLEQVDRGHDVRGLGGSRRPAGVCRKLPQRRWLCGLCLRCRFNVASAPVVRPTPQTVAFGAQPVSTTSAVKNVKRQEYEHYSGDGDSITPSGGFAYLLATLRSTLAAGGSCPGGVDLYSGFRLER